MSADYDRVVAQSKLVSSVSALRRKVGTDHFFKTVNQYFARAPRPSVSRKVKRLYKSFGIDRKPIPTTPFDAYDQLLSQFDDGEYFVPKVKTSRPKHDEIAMVLAAFHDADSTVPVKIVNFCDRTIFRISPRFFVIRMAAANFETPVAAIERMLDWVSELEIAWKKTGVSEELIGSEREKVEKAITNRRLQKLTSEAKAKIPKRKKTGGRKPSEQIADERIEVVSKWRTFRSEYKEKGYVALKGVTKGSIKHFVYWAGENLDDFPTDNVETVKKMIDAARK